MKSLFRYNKRFFHSIPLLSTIAVTTTYTEKNDKFQNVFDFKQYPKTWHKIESIERAIKFKDPFYYNCLEDNEIKYFIINSINNVFVEEQKDEEFPKKPIEWEVTGIKWKETSGEFQSINNNKDLSPKDENAILAVDLKKKAPIDQSRIGSIEINFKSALDDY